MLLGLPVVLGTDLLRAGGAGHRKTPRADEADRGVSALTRPVREASAGAPRKYYEDRLHATTVRPARRDVTPSHIVVHVTILRDAACRREVGTPADDRSPRRRHAASRRRNTR